MKKFLMLFVVLLLNACTTKYILMDEDKNPVDERRYTGSSYMDEDLSRNTFFNANNVFVVSEGDNFVTYQYRSVRVDEVSPLASLYCADVLAGTSSYLREVNMYHNGFMRATFDCVNLAI